MDHPVHHYRGYEILCSATGYTVIKGGAEVLSVGGADAHPQRADCESNDRLLEHARRTVDRLISAEAAR